MEEVDDQVLAAAETLILCSHSLLKHHRLERHDPWSENRRQPASSFEMIPSFLPLWGMQSRRSRYLCISKPVPEESLCPAAKTLPSPATPHDFGTTSTPSTSGSEGAPSSSVVPNNKRHRSGDLSSSAGNVYQQVVAVELPPLVHAAMPSKPIRRKGKKKTITELQGLERSLADANNMLRECVETKRREMGALILDNQRLLKEKSGLQQSRAANEGMKPRYLLPDLNEAVVEI